MYSTNYSETFVILRKNERGIIKNERGIIKNERGIIKNERGIIKNERGVIKKKMYIGLHLKGPLFLKVEHSRQNFGKYSNTIFH
jgi:hypothetical protein